MRYFGAAGVTMSRLDALKGTGDAGRGVLSRAVIILPRTSGMRGRAAPGRAGGTDSEGSAA